MLKKYLFVIYIFSFVTGFILTQVDSYFEIMRSIELFGSVYKEIVNNYVDDVSPRNLMHRGIDGMLRGLDPFSNFIDEKEASDLDVLTTGKYGGIGISIINRGDEIIVSEVMPGYSAQRQGIRVGDVIISIDDEELTKQNIQSVAKKMRGIPGTEVRLKIRRPGENKILKFHLIREEIRVHDVLYSEFVPDEDGIFYLKITRFSKQLSEEVFQITKQVRKKGLIKKIVIDLRSNPGGLLQSAIELLEMFLPKGELILTTKARENDEVIEYRTKKAPHLVDIPLVILIDENSASASEIIAGAIQDLDRGIIVGRRSFGKGLVQTVIPLQYNASLMLTTSRYFTPSGRSIQSNNYLFENKDVILSKIDTTEKIFYTKNGRVVRSGGGITPDSLVPKKHRPGIVEDLLNKGMFARFVSAYLQQKKSFDFSKINEQDLFMTFIKYIEKEKYQFIPQYKKTIEDLIRTLQQNGTAQNVIEEFKKFEQKLNINTLDEIKLYKRDILAEIFLELANQTRAEGFMISVLKKYDPDFQTAIALLRDMQKYNSILMR